MVHATAIHRWKREALASMEAGFSGTLEKSHQGFHTTKPEKFMGEEYEGGSNHE